MEEEDVGIGERRGGGKQKKWCPVTSEGINEDILFRRHFCSPTFPYIMDDDHDPIVHLQ